VSWSPNPFALWPTGTCSSWRMGAQEQKWSESHYQAAWWWGSEASSLTRIISTPVSWPKGRGDSEWGYDVCIYRKSFWKCNPPRRMSVLTSSRRRWWLASSERTVTDLGIPCLRHWCYNLSEIIYTLQQHFKIYYYWLFTKINISILDNILCQICYTYL
jgi:hypothetical protein